jgi:hypothetical protein
MYLTLKYYCIYAVCDFCNNLEIVTVLSFRPLTFILVFLLSDVVYSVQ